MNKNVALSGEYDLKGAKAKNKACKAAAEADDATEAQKNSAVAAAAALEDLEAKIKENGDKRFLPKENASKYMTNDNTTIPFPLKMFETQLSKLRYVQNLKNEKCSRLCHYNRIVIIVIVIFIYSFHLLLSFSINQQLQKTNPNNFH